MNSISKLLAIYFILLISAGCSQNPSKTDGQINANTANLSSSETKNVSTLFKEGKIDVRITTPGNPMGELLQKIDPAKGKIAEQMKALAATLSAKDKAMMEEQSKKGGMMNLAIIMLPLKSVIYVKGDEATAKFDALTFHGENTVNEAKKEGMIYVKSQNTSKAMTLSYTGASFKDMNSTTIELSDYDIKTTGELSDVAGYSCTKSVYTLKNNVSAESATETGRPRGSIYRLEVWTSKQMPKAVNFLHPLYIKEDAGIMKILIQYDKANDLKFIYEFVKVENRPVTTEEMAIKKTEKIRDYGKEKQTIGIEMMGIVFGM